MELLYCKFLLHLWFIMFVDVITLAGVTRPQYYIRSVSSLSFLSPLGLLALSSLSPLSDRDVMFSCRLDIMQGRSLICLLNVKFSISAADILHRNVSPMSPSFILLCFSPFASPSAYCSNYSRETCPPHTSCLSISRPHTSNIFHVAP